MAEDDLWDFREIEPGSALDEFHFELWAGMVSFLIGKDEVRKAFEVETGKRFMVGPRSGIDVMIDKACGLDRDVLNADAVAEFARWATPLYFGDEKAICPMIAAKLAIPQDIAKEMGR